MYFRLQLRPEPDTFMDFMRNLFFEETQVFLMPTTSTQLLHYREKFLDLGLDVNSSINVGYVELGNIASKIQSGVKPVFRYFSSFQIQVWVSLLVTVIFLSLLISIIRKSSFLFFTNLWQNYSILLSKSNPKFFRIKKLWERLITGVWLLSVMILSIHFCEVTLDFMLKAIPEVKIDSWDDLYKRNDIKIIVFNDTPLVEYAMTDNSDMAQKFHSMLEISGMEKWKIDDFRYDVIKKLQSGSHAFVLNKISLIYSLNTLAQMVEKTDKYFKNNIHVSREGGGYLPYFIAVNNKTDPKLLKSLDDM